MPTLISKRFFRFLALIALALPILATGSDPAASQRLRERAEALDIQGMPWRKFVAKRGPSRFDLDSLVSGTASKAAALSLAEAAKLAYEDSDEIRRTTRDWGLPDFQFLDSGRTQGFIASNDRVLLIAFRGTYEFLDWIDNLNVGMVERKYGDQFIGLHSGFLGAYLNVEKDVREAVANADGRQIWMTGHSLGGAIATIAAAELKTYLGGAQVVTFGQPRVGFEALQGYINGGYIERFQRYVNREDPVSALPPKLYFLDSLWPWRHVDRLSHVDHAGARSRSLSAEKALSAEPDIMDQGEFETFREELRRLREAEAEGGPKTRSLKLLNIRGRARSLSDHWMDNYIRAIERME